MVNCVDLSQVKPSPEGEGAYALKSLALDAIEEVING